jgi:hypothetical protein
VNYAAHPDRANNFQPLPQSAVPEEARLFLQQLPPPVHLSPEPEHRVKRVKPVVLQVLLLSIKSQKEANYARRVIANSFFSRLYRADEICTP